MDYGRRAFVLGALALIASGCVTPQIPLPPPVASNIELEVVDDSRDLVRLVASAGAVPRGSTVIVHITDPASGCRAEDFCSLSFRERAGDGSFTSPVFIASDSARVELEYKRPDGADSEPLCLDVDFTAPRNVTVCDK